MTKLLITIDVDTDKPKARALTVSAARPDELPIIRQGAFADRHALLDGVYVEALKRKASPVKKPKGDAAEKPAKAADAETPETPEAEPDQLVRSKDALTEAPADLPEITNDDAPEQPALLEGTDD